METGCNKRRQRRRKALGFALLVAASAVAASTPPPGYTRIEETDAAIQYSGTWNSAASSNYSSGTAVYSTQVGATAQLSFSGTAVRWIGERGHFTGEADVFLDGVKVASINTSSGQNVYQAVLYAASGLSAASHRLTIRVKKVPNAPSGQLAGVWVDAFDVLPLSDTTPPTVSMTAPANGSTVSGTVTVSADASDDTSVAGVQFELDGAALGTEITSTPYSISWDSTTAANGSHTLTAVARDSAGNTATANPVTVTVSNSGGDTTPPTVSITAPASGSTVSGTVTVSANASDDVSVAGVQFMLDGAALGAEVTTAPYYISWNTTTVPNGSHTLTAEAWDGAGNHSTSAPIGVTVSNNTGTYRIEQDNPAVTYVGNWLTASDPSVSGGTAVETNQANATATLTFNGTGATWISYLCTCTAGLSDVYVDGVYMGQVDTNSATTKPQAPVFTVSNLPEGTHALKILVTGQYDRAGNTAYVVVDAFDITP